MNSILQQVVERNRVRRSLSAKRNALQSWRSLVETLLTACPADLIPADDRQLIIRDLLLDLHDKVSEEWEEMIYTDGDIMYFVCSLFSFGTIIFTCILVGNSFEDVGQFRLTQLMYQIT